MENPASQDVDSDSQENYQEENIISLQHLTCKMEQLRQTVEDKDNDPRDAILHPPSEPIKEVLDKYTDTFCTTSKKTSSESSLLQDIPTLNGQDSSQLEDWLTNIETDSELTGESRTKLAQAKLKGLVRTLIMEALTLQKT